MLYPRTPCSILSIFCRILFGYSLLPIPFQLQNSSLITLSPRGRRARSVGPPRMITTPWLIDWRGHLGMRISSLMQQFFIHHNAISWRHLCMVCLRVSTAVSSACTEVPEVQPGNNSQVGCDRARLKLELARDCPGIPILWRTSWLCRERTQSSSAYRWSPRRSWCLLVSSWIPLRPRIQSQAHLK